MNSRIAITLKDYNLGKLKNYKLLTHGFANENYRIETGKGVFHYRIYKRHSMSTVNSEINFLHVLKKTGFPAAFPVQKSDGTYICLVKDKTVVIFDFIEGEIPQLKEKTMSETGKAVAKLNLIDSRKSFQKKNIINIQNAIELVNQFSNAKYQYPDIYHDFSVAVNYLKDKIKDDLPKGFIHGDVFPDNTIFKADKLLAIIDFEEFCIDSLLFDVAMTINGFCFIDNRLDLRLLKSFLDAYESVRPLSKDEKKQLPDYILWTAVGLASWHLQNNMLNIKNDKQTVRVKELLNRYKVTKKLKLKKSFILKILRQKVRMVQ